VTRRRGFTLVEIMIAASITAFIGVVIGGSYYQIDRAAGLVREQSSRESAARLAVTRLASELSMAFLSEHYDRARFRERPTLLKGEEDTILFSTMAHVRRYQDAAESDQSVVEYTVERSPDGDGEALFRREKVHLDEDLDRGGRKDLVADRVEKLELRYWDAVKKEWVRAWNTRSSERANELPSRIRIQVTIKSAQGKPLLFTTQAQIALTAPLDF
jgi:general secretion pathway protein J